MNVMKKITLMIVIAVFVTTAVTAAGQENVADISVEPGKVFVVDEGYSQTLDFDFYIKGTTEETYQIIEVEVKVMDKAGKLVKCRHLRYGGVAPSMLTLPNRELKPNTSIVVFNPFHSFSPDIELAQLRYTFRFATADYKKRTKQEVMVKPVFPTHKTVHALPIKSMSMLDDGNDFYSHHRRIDNNHFVAIKLGIKTNSGRYAMDFMPTNGAGELSKNGGKKLEDYYGFGTPILATADGEVVSVESTMTDPQPGKVDYDIKEVLEKKLVNVMVGNHVVIKHADGEYGSYMHLKQGSPMVKVGDKVKKGQVIGLLGNSGSSYYPHLHYQLTDGKQWTTARGLPIHFNDYKLIRGSKIIPVTRGFINTGDRVMQ